MIIMVLLAGVFKKQRTTSDGFTPDIIKYSLTSTTSAKQECLQNLLLFVTAVVHKKRGFVSYCTAREGGVGEGGPRLGTSLRCRVDRG